MCKYCKRSREFNVHSDDDLHIVIHNNYIPHLITYSTISTDKIISGYININYCPICGEKLNMMSE